MSVIHHPRARWRRRSGEERGATLILIALLVTTLFVIAALVIDLSLVRQNRQADKSATDFAAAAGIRALDNGAGQIQVWKGICAARDFLVANNAELSPLTHVDDTGTPVPDPCAAPPATICGAPATWGTYRGLADAGRIRVTIQNGYDLSLSGFAEDSDEYAGDDVSDPCDHLAVIIEEGEDVRFGGVVGASGYETVIRSVARLEQGDQGDVAAALVLLERNDCQALDVSGTNAAVRVEGEGTTPGVIHSDSLGNGDFCSTIYRVNGTVPPPRIVAALADLADPDTGVRAPGQLSSHSLQPGAAGAVPGNTAPGVEAVCAQELPTDCGMAGGGLSPVARPLIGRSRVDVRYRLPAIGLRNEAAGRFLWSTTNPPPAPEWTTYPTNDPGGCGAGAFTYTAPKVFIDCGGGNFRSSGKTFETSVDEVVINGVISFQGTGGTLHFKDVEKLYLSGATSSLGIGNLNSVLINDGGLTDANGDGFVCDERAAEPARRTRMVIGSGRITFNQGLLRMCQTTLLMADNSASSCPIPSSDGTPPIDNSCSGNISMAGSSRVEWTAPNVNNLTAPTAAQLAAFEDLAFWSETQGSGGNTFDIIGGGGVRLNGIYFTPNADPFKIGGGGAFDIRKAQFITRRLEVAGNGTLVLKPDSANSIAIPVLGGYTLVR